MEKNSQAVIPDNIIVVEGDGLNPVPTPEAGDAGKVLGVLNSSGDIGWVEDQGGTLTQVQSDWAETDSSKVSYIDNKPDLSVYATTSAVNTALAGKQDTISDLSEIRAGATKGDTAVQPATLESYATTSAMNTALAGKQDTISDLAAIRAGAQAGSTAVQPSALESYATTSAMNTALAGKQDVINDLSDIRSGAALGATAVQPADMPSSDELVPSASSGDAGKVLTVDSQGEPQWVTPSGGTTYSAGDGIAIDGNNVISADVDGSTIGIDSTTKKIKLLSAIPSVDQTYSAVSTNAQSGVAVAEAIAAIPTPSVDEVPAVTSSDDGKVLTASYSGGTGSYSWATSSVPSSKPLVAGSNITITDGANDVTIAATVPAVDEVPAVTSSDDGKVLTASYSGGTGSYSWQTAQGGGSSEPTPIAEPEAGYNNLRFKFYDTSYDPSTAITGATWTRVSTNPNMWDCVFPSSNFYFDDRFTSFDVEVVDGYLRLPTSQINIGMFEGCTRLKSVAVHIIFPSNTTSYYMISYFSNCNNLESIRLYGTTAQKGTLNIANICINCYKLRSVDFIGVMDSNSNATTCTIGTSCSSAFSKCYALEGLNGFAWGTSGSRDASNMFAKCYSLTKIPRGLLIVNSSSYMFDSCNSLTHVGSISIKSTSGCNNMFEYCGSLQSVGYITFNTSSTGVNATKMFHGCYSLQGVVFGKSENITNMESMFEGCTALLHLPAISYANTTNVKSMYKNCTLLIDDTHALYTTLSSNPAITTYSSCFSNAGSESIVGTSYLSQIPSSWGGTGA